VTSSAAPARCSSTGSGSRAKLGVHRTQPRPRQRRNNEEENAEDDGRPLRADESHHQWSHRTADPHGCHEQPFERAEHPGQHLVRHGALQQRERCDVDDRVRDPDDGEGDQGGGRSARQAKRDQRNRPQHVAQRKGECQSPAGSHR
jgi:hypothetical protein